MRLKTGLAIGGLLLAFTQSSAWAQAHRDEVKVKDASGREIVAHVVEARTIRYLTVTIEGVRYNLEVTETPSGRILSATRGDGAAVGDLLVRRGERPRSSTPGRPDETVPAALPPRVDPIGQVLLSKAFLDALPTPADLEDPGDRGGPFYKPGYLQEDCDGCGGRLMEYCQVDEEGRIRDATCEWVCVGGTTCALDTTGWKSRL